MNTNYLLIGSGRVSRHFQEYLGLLGLPFEVWSRSQSKIELENFAAQATHVLCLISDPSIESFLRENQSLFFGKTVVHMSGVVTTPLAIGAHPLMGFQADRFYDLQTYRQIPFVIEDRGSTFAELLPGLTNPHANLASEKKTLYHALCVMSGNFTTLLWQKVFADFESKLGLPHEILLPYMRQIERNLEIDPATALTGPLARKDISTIQRHLNELGNDAFADVYRSFVRASGLDVSTENKKQREAQNEIGS